MEGETEIYFLGNCKDRAWKIKHEVPIDIYIAFAHYMLYCWNCRLICLSTKIFLKSFINRVTKPYDAVNKVLYASVRFTVSALRYFSLRTILYFFHFSYTCTTNKITTVYREIFAPILFSPFSPSLQAGEF